MAILGLFVLPFTLAIAILCLYIAGIISDSLKWLVKLASLYLPAICLLVMLYIFGRPIEHSSNRLGVDLHASKTRSVKMILKKWNENKFHPLGFSWTYCEQTNSLELSIDTDLEIFEEKSESMRKSLKNT